MTWALKRFISPSIICPPRADHVYAGTVSDVRRKMDELVEHVNPEYFNWNNGGDIGLLPLDVVKAQIRLFGEKIMKHYR